MQGLPRDALRTTVSPSQVLDPLCAGGKGLQGLWCRGLIISMHVYGEWMPLLPSGIHMQSAGLNRSGPTTTMPVFLSFWVNPT